MPFAQEPTLMATDWERGAPTRRLQSLLTPLHPFATLVANAFSLVLTRLPCIPEDTTVRRAISRFLIPLALGFLVAPLAAVQPPGKMPRIGVLTVVTAPTTELVHALLRQRLRELGYVEGQNIVLEWRSAERRSERLPALAAELVALPVDVLVTWGTPAAVAAKQATSTVPIIFLAVGDPVGSGIVASLPRPGGNVTGLTNLSAELSAKLLELLKEVIPGLPQIAVLRNPGNPAWGPRRN